MLLCKIASMHSHARSPDALFQLMHISSLRSLSDINYGIINILNKALNKWNNKIKRSIVIR